MSRPKRSHKGQRQASGNPRTESSNEGDEQFSQPSSHIHHPNQNMSSAYNSVAATQHPFPSLTVDPRQYQHLSNFQQAHVGFNLDISSYEPAHGVSGTEITVLAKSLHDLRLYPSANFSIYFGDTHCQASLHELGVSAGVFQYALVSKAPSISSSLSGMILPLSLHFEDNMYGAIANQSIGYFTFVSDTDSSRSGSRSSSGKRRMSAQMQSGGSQTHPSVRPSAPGLHGPSIPYPPESLTRAASTLSLGTGYNRAHARNSSQDHLIESVEKPHRPRVEIPLPEALDNVSESESPQSHRNASPAVSSRQAGRRTLQTPTTPAPGVPTLVRTSTIRQPVPGTSGRHSPESFNPYVIYPNNKAHLELDGDLDSMAENWTDEERAANRRLVQFERRQDGSTIFASFRPVSGRDRKYSGPCISCIWWAEKGEAYVTSVDTIYLLESLVAVRFTVEEKNRIRRNLEGFHPLTVSKSKSDSEDFFSVIMGFPDPKPRNIEKDVKVFPWKSLSSALKKIIGKYSASYSSTAGLQHPPLQVPGPSSGPSQLSPLASQMHSQPQLVVPSQSPSALVDPHHTYPIHLGQGQIPHYGSWTGAQSGAYDIYAAQQYHGAGRPPMMYGNSGPTASYSNWSPPSGVYDQSPGEAGSGYGHPSTTSPPGSSPYPYGGPTPQHRHHE